MSIIELTDGEDNLIDNKPSLISYMTQQARISSDKVMFYPGSKWERDPLTKFRADQLSAKVVG